MNLETQYRYPDDRDRIALAYAEKHEPFRGYWRRSEDRALSIAERIVRGKKGLLHQFLDVGCGEGRLLERFAKQSSVVVAIEPDPTRAAAALEKVWAQGLRNVQVFQSRVEGAVLPAGTFDAALCSHVIQHARSDEAQGIIQGIHRLLKPKGFLVLLTTHARRRDDVFRSVRKEDAVLEKGLTEREFNDLVVNNHGVLPVRLFSSRSLRELLKEWFSVVRLRVLNSFYPPVFLDRLFFRDRLINLPFVNNYFGEDVMIVARKKS